MTLLSTNLLGIPKPLVLPSIRPALEADISFNPARHRWRARFHWLAGKLKHAGRMSCR